MAFSQDLLMIFSSNPFLTKYPICLIFEKIEVECFYVIIKHTQELKTRFKTPACDNQRAAKLN